MTRANLARSGSTRAAPNRSQWKQAWLVRSGQRIQQRHAIKASNGILSTEFPVGNDTALAQYLSEGFQAQRRVDGKLACDESFAASGYIPQRTAGEA
jgi:hypothetical protein